MTPFSTRRYIGQTRTKLIKPVGVTSVAEGVADLFSLRAVLGKHTTGSSSLHMEDGMDHVSSAVLTGCFFVLPDKRLPLLVVHIV